MPRECDVNLGTLDAKLSAISEDVKKCEKLLSGNGDPEKGLVVQVDRIKQTLATQKKFTWAFLTAIVFPWLLKLVEKFQ
jgi:hypothetical protein